MEARYFSWLVLLAALSGCAAGGLRKAPDMEAARAPRKIALRLQAAQKLNTDAQGRPLALVTRVYTLRQKAAFEAAPYAAFLTPGADREAFGADLVEVRDVTLVPGQRYEVVERVPREAAYVGVVALFHSPAAQGWRMSFASADAESSGIAVSVQARALSAGAAPQANATPGRPPGFARRQ